MNTMKALAKELLREVQTIDDYQAAKTLLLDKIATDQMLRQVAIEFAVETFLANEWRAGRSARWRASAAVSDELRTEPAFGGGVRAAPPTFALRRKFAEVVLEAKKTLLLDWELSPGVRMRDATREILSKHAALNESQASVMSCRAAWYRGLAALLPDAKTRVGAVLRESDLRREERKAKDGATAN
jgi:hypothetical protein